MGRIVSSSALLLALAGALVCAPAWGDDGSLYHQQRLQQQKGQFELMLEQLNERARQRARARRSSSGSGDVSSPVTSLEQAQQPLRLGIRPATPSSAPRDPAQTADRARFRQEGQQRRQRILDEQQRRQALVADRGADRGLTSGVTASRQLRLNDSRVRQQQRSLQRKLTY